MPAARAEKIEDRREDGLVRLQQKKRGGAYERTEHKEGHKPSGDGAPDVVFLHGAR